MLSDANGHKENEKMKHPTRSSSSPGNKIRGKGRYLLASTIVQAFEML